MDRQVISLLAAVLLAAPASAEDAVLRGRARDILNKNAPALVAVKLVVKTRFEAQGRDDHESEDKTEVAGTVIDPGGLTVIPNHELESYATRFSLRSDGEELRFQSRMRIAEAKIILGDGTEVPAQVVLTDKDLDLAFVRPKEKPAEPWPHVALRKASEEPDVMDPVVAIERLSRDLDRAPAVTLARISAVLRKPRTFYLLGNGAACMGCPVFNERGEAFGLALRRSRGAAGPDTMDWAEPVVLPAEDVLEASAQALAAGKSKPKQEAKVPPEPQDP